MYTKITFEMEGAQCVRSEDGSLTFKRKTLMLVLTTIFISLFELPLLGLFVSSLSSFSLRPDYLRDVILLGITATFLGYVLFILLRQLRAPQVQFNTPRRLLIIGQREIPFSQISFLLLPTPPDPTPRANVAGPSLTATLTTGEILRLGCLSGKYTHLAQRTQQFAQLLRETTGLAVKNA